MCSTCILELENLNRSGLETQWPYSLRNIAIFPRGFQEAGRVLLYEACFDAVSAWLFFHVSCTFRRLLSRGGMGVSGISLPLPTFKKIWGEYGLFYSAVLVCAVLTAKWIICVYTCVSSLFGFSFPFRSPQSTKQSPLCCAAALVVIYLIRQCVRAVSLHLWLTLHNPWTRTRLL